MRAGDTTNYRLTIAYRGAAYAGWQRQANAPTVQQLLEEALADLVGAPARVVGASRTDAGVHARAQVAHLQLPQPFPPRALVYGTNFRLPVDVRVLAAAQAPPDFHARRQAQGKEYRYRMRRSPVLSPLDTWNTLRISPGTEVEPMRRASDFLPGRHDFSAFALAGGSHRAPFRRLFAVEWKEEGDLVELRLVGDGFLRGMVRALVGTLLEVGRGRRTPESFAALLTGRPRGEGGPTAPAHALTLWEVFYPDSRGGPDLANRPASHGG